MKTNLSPLKQIFKKLGLLTLLFLLTFQACKKDSPLNSLSDNTAKSSVKTNVENELFTNNEWKNQLEKVLLSGNDSLKRSNIKMIGYEYQGTIKNTNEVTALKTSILLGENYIPILSKDILNKFSITTFQDAKRVAQSIGEQNKAQLTIDLIQKHLDKEIKAGLDIVKINWEANGKVFTSTCIASKDSGIVYDNMLSNVMLVKVSTTINFKSAVPSKVTNSQTTMLDLEDWTPISWYRKDEIVASWLWGSERGNAWVERQVNGAKSSANVKSISDYHSQAFDYMTLGQSESHCTVEEGDPSTGPFGSIKFIWGMYLASPVGSITMTLKNGAYIFTMNNILSESHNSGTDSISPSSLN